MHVDPNPPPRPRPASAVRARLAPTLAAAIAAIAANAGAQTPTGLSIVPSVQVRQIVTNNVELSPTQARAEIGWLDPLPEGMFVAPPLTTAKGG